MPRMHTLAAVATGPVIRVRGLIKRYGDLVAVDGIDFDVAAGEVFGLLGPNGAGKTTTVEILEGLRSPDGGQAMVLGVDVADGADSLKPRIGVSLQTASMYPKLTVVEVIDLFRSFYPKPRPADELIDLGLGMSSFAELEQVDQFICRTWLRVEAPEQVDDLDHGQLRVERRGLETDPDAGLERVCAARDVKAEDDRLAAVGRAQALEDLDRRRLARAVRTQQREQLAAPHVERDPAQDLATGIGLAQPVDDDRGVRGCGGRPAGRRR